jgi:hypothetical protein
MAEGYCGNSDPISIERVQELFAEAAPYAEGVLAAGDLLPHLTSQVAPRKSMPEPRNFPTEQQFRAAVAGGLTTFVVNEWRAADQPVAAGEASAQVEMPAEVDGNKAGQKDAAAEENNVGAAHVTK